MDKPKTPCLHCGQATSEGKYCFLCNAKRVKPQQAGQRNLYNTRRWRKACKAWLNEHPLCESCLALGIINAGTHGTNHVHHTVKHNHNPDVFWDSSLWSTQCPAHHNSLSARGF